MCQPRNCTTSADAPRGNCHVQMLIVAAQDAAQHEAPLLFDSSVFFGTFWVLSGSCVEWKNLVMVPKTIIYI